jgi:hypothetical protein
MTRNQIKNNNCTLKLNTIGHKLANEIKGIICIRKTHFVTILTLGSRLSVECKAHEAKIMCLGANAFSHVRDGAQ